MAKEPNEDYRKKTYPCPECKVNTVAAPKKDEPLSPIHGYKLYCLDCGKFIAWSGYKKQIAQNGERKFSSQWSAKRVGIDYCQICLRYKDDLGRSEHIETHHIIQVCDGGEDELDNLMFLCTACHNLVHYQRTYLNRHLRPLFEAYKALKLIKKHDPSLHNQVVTIYKKAKVNNGNLTPKERLQGAS